MTAYQPLPDILERLNRHLQDGEHVVLTGHRRIGKTKLMQHLEDLAPDSFAPTYLIVESVDTVNEFYRKLVIHLSENFIDRWEKTGRGVKHWFQRINITEVGKTIRFGDPKQIDYHAEFQALVDNMEPERPIALMLDEFPQVIENIRDGEDGIAEVKRLLTTQREFRQEPRFKDKIRFVYAGSIGLQNVVEGLGFTKHINDLREVKMRPFRRDEAETYLAGLLRHRNLEAAPEVAALILDKIDWLAPFFIGLLVDELPASSPVEARHVEDAFTASLTHRNHFEHWHRRLKPPALEKAEYRFCKTLLNALADPGQPGLDSGAIYNLAVTQSVEDEVPRLLNILEHDGYLVRDGQRRYRFISPVIRAWWWNAIAN